MKYAEADYSLWKFVRTNEGGFSLYVMLVILFYIIGVRIILGDGLWYVDVFLAGIIVALWVRAYLIRKRLRDLGEQAPYNPNNHYADVCEGCTPVTMADGHSPILNIVWYWAAYKSIIREDAQRQVDDPVLGPKILSHHKHYLAKPQFNR